MLYFINYLLTVIAENTKSVTMVSKENVWKFRASSVTVLLHTTASVPFKL